MTTARLVFPHQLFSSTSTSTPRRCGARRARPVLPAARLPPAQAGAAPGDDAQLRGAAARARASPTAYVADVGRAHQRRAAARGARASTTSTRSRAYDVVDDWLDRDLRARLPRRRGAADRRGDPGLPHLARRDRRDVRRREAAADAALLRAAAPPPRPADGRRPARSAAAGPTTPRTARSCRRTCRSPRRRGPPAPTTSRDAIAWVEREFPDNPGDLAAYHWPTTHRQAESWLTRFLEERFAAFGPYEDAIAADEPWLFHSVLSPLLNIGLLDPRHVVERARRARRGARRRPAQRRGLRAAGDRLARVHARVVRRARPRACAPATCSASPASSTARGGTARPASTRSTP